VLLGSGSGIGTHERTCRVRVGDQHTLTLSLKNHDGRGTVKVAYNPTAAGSLNWSRLVAVSHRWIVGRILEAKRAFAELSWAMQVSLAIQLVLAVGFAYLLLHSGEGRPVKEESSLAGIAESKSHERDPVVAELKETRALLGRQLEAGGRESAWIHRELEALAKDQQRLHEQISSYEKSAARSAIEIERRVERRLLPELQKPQLELVQVRQQIQELASAKESLKQDLAAVLKQQSETLARMRLQPPTDGPQSHSASGSPSLAQAESKPLTFWVSFREGTSEGHIQELLHQIHGRKIKGPTPTGWINVEAQLKQSESIEGFFETVKKSKIVSAITTSLSGQ